MRWWPMASRWSVLATPLVEIVPASLVTLAAEEDGGGALAACLGVGPPQSWPPSFNDTYTRAWMRLLIEHPDRAGFGSWYIVADGRLVGVCGCKGPPDHAGKVEIGYAVIAAEQGKGHAGAAMAWLLAYVAADPKVNTVLAETLPPMLASRRLPLRQGFSLVGERHHVAFGRLLQFCRRVR